tara:strand:+ start:47935 stop:48237 length:303 start_codon:yes stop_codon:yes gene_type:complete
MSEKHRQRRAYVSKVQNNKARTSASKEYIQLIVESGESYLFTATDFDKAKKRADKNPEDIISVNFDTQEPVIRVSGVAKVVLTRRARRRLNIQKSYTLIN